jgi:hypothetical protein
MLGPPQECRPRHHVPLLLGDDERLPRCLLAAWRSPRPVAVGSQVLLIDQAHLCYLPGITQAVITTALTALTDVLVLVVGRLLELLSLECARLRIVAAAGLCAVSACAPLPFRGARFSEASLPPSDAAAVVHVFHIGNYYTPLGPLTERLYIDGKNGGVLNYYQSQELLLLLHVRACEYVSVTLPPGSHEFRADYDPPLDGIAATATSMDLEAGQTYWVRIYSQAPPTTGWRSQFEIPKVGHTVEVVDRDTGLRDIADCRRSRTP